MRQSKTLPQTSVPLLLWVFAGCCKPLLGDGSSRRYLRTPCMVAWTLTPWCPSSALTRFFPGGIGLTLVAKGSAHQIFPAMQLQQGHNFEAAVIPLCSSLHAHLASRLHLPMYSSDYMAARPFTPRIGHVVTHSCPVVSLHV